MRAAVGTLLVHRACDPTAVTRVCSTECTYINSFGTQNNRWTQSMAAALSSTILRLHAFGVLLAVIASLPDGKRGARKASVIPRAMLFGRDFGWKRTGGKKSIVSYRRTPPGACACGLMTGAHRYSGGRPVRVERAVCHASSGFTHSPPYSSNEYVDDDDEEIAFLIRCRRRRYYCCYYHCWSKLHDALLVACSG